VIWDDGEYDGIIADIKPRKKLFLVNYEDGDSFWETYDPISNSLITTEH
jgi:hypothetical protein